MRYALQDRTYTRDVTRHATLAEAGMAMLQASNMRWVLKRRPDLPRILPPDGYVQYLHVPEPGKYRRRRKLAAWGLYVTRPHDGLELWDTEYAFRREDALRKIMARLTERKTWSGTPAAFLYVVELTTPQQRRVARQAARV